MSYIVRAFWWLFCAVFAARHSAAFMVFMFAMVAHGTVCDAWWWVMLVTGAVLLGAMEHVAERHDARR